MTITISSILDQDLIVMVSDSVITKDYGVHQEYRTGRKFCVFPGVGCITTWGRQSGNRIEHYLENQGISAKSHSVEDLKDITFHYLKEEFRPHDYEDPEDVGYHVGGFDRQGKPRLYHLFWGRNRPSTSPDELPDYHRYDHSDIEFLYNGRNDLADTMVRTYLNQVRTGQPTRYAINTLVGRVQFCDYVARWAAEMTLQVGPPLIINLIFPNNNIERIVNPSFCPVEIEERILGMLHDLAVVAERRDEQPISFEEMKRRLKEDGIL